MPIKQIKQVNLRDELMRVRLSFDTQLAEVLLRRLDLTHVQIEKEFGISKTVIRRVKKQCNIAARKRGPKPWRGNPNWGRPLQTLPVLLTEFEMQVQCLGLTKEQYIASAQLEHWCERNRNRCYVPEWLLDAWGLTVMRGD